MELGEKIKVLRIENRMTAEELAKYLKIGRSTLSNYENNIRKPDYDALVKIAEYFNVSIDYLLGRTNDRTIEILRGDEVLKELRDLGIEEIGILKEFRDSGFTKEEIMDIIDFAKKIKK